MLWLAALALQAADGEALLRSLREKVAAAPALRMEFRLQEGAARPGEIRGVLKLKGADKWSLEIQMSRGPGRTESAYVLYDGRRAAAGGMAANEPPLAPEKAAAAFRGLLAEVPVFLGFDSVLSRRKSGRALPKAVEIKEGAKETVDGRELRCLQYVLRMPEQDAGRGDVAVKLLLDARTLVPVRRDVDLGGFTMTEHYAVFDLAAEIPDQDFVYATPARLAAARAVQAARAVELFTLYTGRQPASLAELAARPVDLPPGAFWPDGGFPVPADPAGKPYALARKEGRLHVGEVPVAPGTGRAIGAPTERIRAHLTARVRLQLLAAAARAWHDTYGEVPTDLLARPDGLPWPEGGWIAALPPGFALTKTAGLVRIQAAAPERLVPTPEEIAALEAVAAPRLDEVRRAAALQACDALGVDNLAARLDAEARLRSLGEAAAPLLEERLRKEKDAETAGRLRELLRAVPRAPSPWKRELGQLRTFVGAGGAASSNERNASASLKTLASAEADFRANDRDNNKLNDFWTGDVAGLYVLKPSDGGDMIKLVELSVAAADAAPLPKGAAGGLHPGLEHVAVPAPKAGYFFQAMTHASDETPTVDLRADTGGDPKMGKVHHVSKFGFCAFPAEYGASGTLTYILNEGNTLFSRDTQGEPVLEWPGDDELKREWRKVD